MKIQLCSDLHLDINKYSFDDVITPSADILILAGDIAEQNDDVYERFISHCNDRFKTVLVISGNHEYYNSNIKETDECIEFLTKQYKNVHYLNNKTYVDSENNLYIGTTLWSNIPQEHGSFIKKSINDYHHIEDFTTLKSSTLFWDNVFFIEKTLSQSDKYNKIVMISHHSPLLRETSHIQFRDLKTIYAFGNNLNHLMKRCDYWFYGHTHYNTNIKYDRCNIISNQLGYVHTDRVGIPYDKAFTIDI